MARFRQNCQIRPCVHFLTKVQKEKEILLRDLEQISFERGKIKAKVVLIL